MSTSNLKQAPATEPAPKQPTAEALGWQLRAALPPLRLHSVSLYDRAGEVLWLSEGALGPDEHAFVIEALSTLAADPSAAHSAVDFDDGRGAVFLAVRSPQAELVGLVMILVDAKTLSTRELAARILAPLRTLLQRLAILLRPKTGTTETSRTLEILEWSPPEPAAVAGLSASAPAETILAPPAVEQILTLELAEAPPPAPLIRAEPEVASERPVVMRQATCELYVQELTKLRPGGRTRRLQLLPAHSLAVHAPSIGSGHAEANQVGAIADRTLLGALRELAGWLGAHAALAESAALSFSIAVPPALLEIDDLPERIVECILSMPVAPESIGIEITEATCVRESERAERLVHALERVGSFLVLDDFQFDSGALEVLRSKALRLVKVERSLIRESLRDKLAQARIVAISQAARVLGIHCVAKHVESIAIQRWLAAAGFDFAEGPLFGRAKRLDSLAEEVADH